MQISQKCTSTHYPDLVTLISLTVLFFFYSTHSSAVKSKIVQIGEESMKFGSMVQKKSEIKR